MALPDRSRDGSALAARAGAAGSPLEDAERLLRTLHGALRASAPVAAALAGQGLPAFAAELAKVRQDPARRRSAEGFMQARAGAEEVFAKGRQQLEAVKNAPGAVARAKAIAELPVPGLKTRSAALIAAMRALRLDPSLGPLLPSALGEAPAAGADRLALAPRAAASASPAAGQPGARTWQAAPAAVATSATRTVAAAREGAVAAARGATAPPDGLAGTAKAIAPLYRYTAERLLLLAAGVAFKTKGELPDGSKASPLIARALAAVFTDLPPAYMAAGQAIQQTEELRRALFAARQPDPSLTPARLRGLAMPLTSFPRRFAPFPVLNDIFPPVG